MFRKRGKKGQAAMEFLMTYGWAILVILIALGVLFYLGVFSPKTPNQCISTAPITTCDVKLLIAPGTTGEVSVTYPTSVNTVTFKSIDFDGTGATDCTATPVALTSGTKATFTCGAAHNIASAEKYSGSAVISYQNEGSTISHDVRVTISGSGE